MYSFVRSMLNINHCEIIYNAASNGTYNIKGTFSEKSTCVIRIDKTY